MCECFSARWDNASVLFLISEHLGRNNKTMTKSNNDTTLLSSDAVTNEQRSPVQFEFRGRLNVPIKRIHKAHFPAARILQWLMAPRQTIGLVGLYGFSDKPVAGAEHDNAANGERRRK